METLGNYLLQMAGWLTGFWLVYIIFLQNDTFFKLNRWFLLSGIVASIIIPFFPIRYNVEMGSNLPPMLQLAEIPETNKTNESFSMLKYWGIIYIAGVLFFIFRFVLQTFKLRGLRNKSECITLGSTHIFKLEKETAPFSFFNSIFVSKNLCGDVEFQTVIAHEKVHIEELHWVDLLFLEMARALQWFNPLLILYRKAMMQNHEFLADSGTLQKGVSARTYKAILANQMLGIPVLQVANGFTILNQNKRILMMNKNKTTAVKRFKLLWAIPVIAFLLAAFAKPNYVSGENTNIPTVSNNKTIAVKGKVTDESGKPLNGTSIIVKGTNIGTVSNEKGNYSLTSIDPEAELVFSYVGYETKVVKASSKLNVSMSKKVVVIGYENDQQTPPPPPPPTNFQLSSSNSNKPLIILDEKDFQGDLSQIDPTTIERIEVLKDQSATAIYGDKGKDGVVIITTKKGIAPPPPPPPIPAQNEETVFVIVEQMPEFPGGEEALSSYITAKTSTTNEQGFSDVYFIINTDGKVKDVKAISNESEKLNKLATEIISGMPKWKPGMQRGKTVPVSMQIRINFGLNAAE